MSRALATARFKADGLDSSDLSAIMENLDSFLTDEKSRAEHRIKTCESFLNDPNLTSQSIKDGLSSLLQNAEDDYGTLLHLEKVVLMKNAGEPEKRTFNNRTASANISMGSSLPASMGWSSYMAPNRRDLQVPSRSSRSSGQSRAAREIDEQPDFVFDVDDVHISGGDIIDENENDKETSDEEKLGEEDDEDVEVPQRQVTSKGDDGTEEEVDDFDINTAYPERIRQRRLSAGESLAVARSLPLSVPIHKHPLLSKTDAEDEFNDIADIPTKIAELAKSVHGGDIFGDLPSPRYQHNVG